MDWIVKETILVKFIKIVHYHQFNTEFYDPTQIIKIREIENEYIFAKKGLIKKMLNKYLTINFKIIIK